MINDTLDKWRGGPRTLIKKLFIGYLALVTGCTTTVQQVEQAAAVEHARGFYNQPAVTAQEAQPQPQPHSASNPYNLPELGGGAAKENPPSRASDDFGHNSGGLPLSAQQDVANPLNKGFGDVEAFQNMATAMLASTATDDIKQWFSARHATAELSMSTGKRGVKSGSFDLLMPIFDGEKDLVFTQIGVRRSNAMTEDYRTTVNLGIGYRRNFDNWLAGANAFYDRDITGKNSRFGIGAEAFTDNLKTSANIYVRATDWHKSPDLEDYLERPANGYDLRVEANLPSHPQLGGKLIYEQYFGDQVGLFGAGNRQKDPSAVTVGVSYSPVPMITGGVDYRQGQGGLSETSVKLSVNYQFGVPLSKQLDLEYSKNHKLQNSRYDLVNRRNDIVLEYREKDAGQITLPAQVNGTPSQTISFPVKVSDHSISSFTWTGSAASYALPFGGGPTGSLTLPAYIDGGVNTYTLQITGADRFGRVVQSNPMQVTVNAFMIALERSKGSVMANGTDSVLFTATLQEPDGSAKPNTPVTWDVAGVATVTEKDAQTDGKGQARLTLTSRFASAVRVTVQEPQGAKAENDADFAGDQHTAKVVGLVASPDVITANGSSVSQLTAKITDANGNPVGPGVPVTWNATRGSLSSISSVTGDDSNSVVTLTSGVVVEVANVTASAVAGAASASVKFVADAASELGLTATPSSITADGSSTSTLSATVKDAHGNLVAGAPVSWTASAGTLGSSSTTSNASGVATVVLTSATTAGAATVEATSGAASKSAVVAFTVGAAATVTVTAAPSSITADGSSTSTLSATVKDAHGNLVAGVPVSWTASAGTLGSSSTTSNASGVATVVLTSATTAGSATIDAKSGGASGSAVIAMSADVSTAKVVSLVAAPSSITADGSSTSTLSATVKDAHGNLVAGAPVSWTASAGTLGSSSTTSNASGVATVVLTSATTAGSASVSASAGSGSASAVVAFTAGAATSVTVTAAPSSITADGSSTSTLSATVKDAHGNLVAGVPVSWTASAGTLGSSSTTSNASGVATVVLTSATTAGSASVNASAGTGSASAVVAFTAGVATSVTVTAAPSSITADGSSTSTLSATVKDAHGNLVAGLPVSWTASAGTLGSSSTTSNASGVATVVLTSATTAGPANITGKAGIATGSAVVAMVADASTAKVVAIVATPTSIASDGVASSTLVATVKDAFGNSLGAGFNVTWATTLGTLSKATSVTDANGNATVGLTGTTVGVATVTAQATVSGNASTTVVFMAPKPVVSSFTSTCNQKGKIFGNAVCFDGSAGAYSYTNTLSWTVANAVRYSVSNGTSVIYAGTGSSFNIGNGTYYGNFFWLTAYSTNSADSPSTTIAIQVGEVNTDPGSQNGS